MLAGCVGTALLHLSWLRRFRRLFRRPVANPPAFRDDSPSVLVVLSLRGADPFLRDCLQGLFRQNYQNYCVRIVIDCREDPAWAIVEDAIRACGARNVEVRTLDARLSTCGLRVSSLIQEFSGLDNRWQVVAYLDADTIPYPNWLGDLVAPLGDPSVGATTGIRWYVPAHRNLGTLVRTVWNIGAVIQMTVFGIAWGGSMAFQARLFREPYLIDKWSRLLWEDTFTRRAMQDLGLRLEFVTQAVLPNREKISLRSCFRYMTRQVLNVRLYHDSWTVIACYGVWTVLGPIVAVSIVLTAVAQNHLPAALLCGGGLLVHLGSQVLISMWSGLIVRRTVCARGEQGWGVPPKIIVAACITPMVYAASIIAATFVREIEWRGVVYRIHGPWRIERGSWQPCRSASAGEDSTISL